MNSFYHFALAILGLGLVVNLAATIVLARRPRSGSASANVPGVFPDGGRPLPEFTASTKDGEPLATTDLEGPGETVIAFFSTNCGPCMSQAPRFAELVADSSGTNHLTVVTGLFGNTKELLSRVPASGPLVHEEDSGTMATAFEVFGFPAFVHIKDGKIRSMTHSVDSMRRAIVVR